MTIYSENKIQEKSKDNSHGFLTLGIIIFTNCQEAASKFRHHIVCVYMYIYIFESFINLLEKFEDGNRYVENDQPILWNKNCEAVYHAFDYIK